MSFGTIVIVGLSIWALLATALCWSAIAMNRLDYDDYEEPHGDIPAPVQGAK